MNEKTVSPKVDTSRPSVARMYDFYLDGKDNFAVDREAVARVEKVMPDVRRVARENRAFLRRAVRLMAATGVRQFVDIGAGLPTVGNTHEIAKQSAPGSRVVYVDNDPIVLAHGRALLVSDETTAVVAADLRRPSTVVEHPETRQLIDFQQPVGVLLIAMTHFLLDTEREQVMGELLEAIAPGSQVAITHVTGDRHPRATVEGVELAYSATPTPIYFRSYPEVLRFFDGLALVEPGVVFVDRWRPDPAEATGPATDWLYGGVAQKL